MEVTLTKEEYRELKKHGRLEKDGCVYSHLAKLNGRNARNLRKSKRYGLHRRGEA